MGGINMHHTAWPCCMQWILLNSLPQGRPGPALTVIQLSTGQKGSNMMATTCTPASRRRCNKVQHSMQVAVFTAKGRLQEHVSAHVTRN